MSMLERYNLRFNLLLLIMHVNLVLIAVTIHFELKIQ